MPQCVAFDSARILAEWNPRMTDGALECVQLKKSRNFACGLLQAHCASMKQFPTALVSFLKAKW